MTRLLIPLGSLILFAAGATAQTADKPPAFDLADVHVSPHRTAQGTRGPVIRTSGRYEFTNATMVDLIHTAYNVDADKILGGPSWLESDHFDIYAKVPPKTSADAARPMLKALLEDRFKLVLHEDRRPLPTYALSVSKGGHKLKESDGSGEPGCKMTLLQNSALDANALQSAAQNGGQVTIRVATFLQSCHGVSMESFAAQLHDMIAAQIYLGNNPPVDQTGLPGKWDFEFKYTAKPPANGSTILGTANGAVQINMAGDYISLFDAVEKQLGLKLEPATLPIPVILVDSALQRPTPNPPEVAAQVPPGPAAEFEVAEIRMSPPGPVPPGSRGFQPNGQVDLRGYLLRNLIVIGWDLDSPDQIADAPKWLESAKVDLIAKMTLTGPPNNGIDVDALRPAVRSLLQDRFKVKLHTEMRPGMGWALSANKPKLAKADPVNRSTCKEGPGKDGKDPRTANPILSRLLTCQNVTMEQFIEQLHTRNGGYFRPAETILDQTGLKDAYDFTISFSAAQLIPGTMISKALANGGAIAFGPGRGGDGANPNDPTGALSLMDALNKQLGLKLEQQKMPVLMYVLDHIEEKPVE